MSNKKIKVLFLELTDDIFSPHNGKVESRYFRRLNNFEEAIQHCKDNTENYVLCIIHPNSLYKYKYKAIKDELGREIDYVKI